MKISKKFDNNLNIWKKIGTRHQPISGLLLCNLQRGEKGDLIVRFGWDFDTLILKKSPNVFLGKKTFFSVIFFG